MEFIWSKKEDDKGAQLATFVPPLFNASQQLRSEGIHILSSDFLDVGRPKPNSRVLRQLSAMEIHDLLMRSLNGAGLDYLGPGVQAILISCSFSMQLGTSYRFEDLNRPRHVYRLYTRGKR